MLKSVKSLAASGTLGLAMAFATAPAHAQLGLGVDADVDLDIGVRTSDPRPHHRHETYVYNGYESGHWHTHHDVRRTNRWYARYNGYDCYESFQYTWENGERVRYDTTFCYKENGKRFEPKGARASVRIR